MGQAICALAGARSVRDWKRSSGINDQRISCLCRSNVINGMDQRAPFAVRSGFSFGVFASIGADSANMCDPLTGLENGLLEPESKAQALTRKLFEFVRFTLADKVRVRVARFQCLARNAGSTMRCFSSGHRTTRSEADSRSHRNPKKTDLPRRKRSSDYCAGPLFQSVTLLICELCLQTCMRWLICRVVLQIARLV